MDITDYIKRVKDQFQKDHKDSHVRFNTASQEPPPFGLELDNPLLEYVLSRRFFSKGRCYLIYGKKGCSKTSLLLDQFKTYQQAGGLAVWIETEHAADFDYAAMQGVDTSKLLYHNPKTLEEGLELAWTYGENAEMGDKTPIIVGFDSLAGTLTEYEEEQDDMFQSKPGEHAKIMARFYREYCGLIGDKNMIFVATNQLKDKIGGMPTYGADALEAMIGGDAPRFHSTVQLKMSKTGEIMAPDHNGIPRKAGSNHKVTAVRNKLGLEGKDQSVPFDLYTRGGIDWYTPLVKFLGERYKNFVSGAGWVKWGIEDTKYIAEAGESKVIDTDHAYRPHELAVIIKNSVDAKEMIRKAFLVRDWPTPEEMLLLENVEKKEVKKKKL